MEDFRKLENRGKLRGIKVNYRFTYKDQIYDVVINNRDKHGQVAINLGDEKYLSNASRISSNCLSLIVEDQSYQVYLAEEGSILFISVFGEVYRFESADADGDQKIIRERKSTDIEKELTIAAPMPGSLIRMDVKEGDIVKKGQCLAIIEAMKMETGLHATLNGKVKKVFAVKNQQVNTGDILIELEKIS